ncbi:MAG: 2-oxoacid:acceptor oxidoreductase family protein [Acidaminococcales bacterium]|nr:2-oxoacid:acceptor oxidoreductase family protein [Acidaminococcales bacterium]
MKGFDLVSVYEVTISGFGGQGVLFMGQLLAHAANRANLETSWLPAYGPEMRGGTANCMVVISKETIDSPFILNPTAVIAMNKPSMERFEPQLKENGLLVLNVDMINKENSRGDVNVYKIQADTIAGELGETKAANMVALGAFIRASEILDIDLVSYCLKYVFAENKETTD